MVEIPGVITQLYPVELMLEMVGVMAAIVPIAAIVAVDHVVVVGLVDILVKAVMEHMQVVTVCPGIRVEVVMVNIPKQRGQHNTMVDHSEVEVVVRHLITGVQLAMVVEERFVSYGVLIDHSHLRIQPMSKIPPLSPSLHTHFLKLKWKPSPLKLLNSASNSNSYRTKRSSHVKV